MDTKPAVQSSVIMSCVLAGISALAVFVGQLLAAGPIDWKVAVPAGIIAVVSAIAAVLRAVSAGGTPVVGVVSSPAPAPLPPAANPSAAPAAK